MRRPMQSNKKDWGNVTWRDNLKDITKKGNLKI